MEARGRRPLESSVKDFLIFFCEAFRTWIHSAPFLGAFEKQMALGSY